MRTGRILLLAAVAAAGGCGAERLEGRAVGGTAEAPAEVLAVVDSVLPIERALEDFRGDVRPTDGLRGGAPSASDLLREILARVAAGDTASLERLTLDRAEFAYLYYPDAPIARPPYELPPSLAWFRMQQENRTALLRLLRELGGEPLGDAELLCASPPVEQGANRLHGGCLVRAGGRDLRLFGSLIERDGVFKVLSWANDY